jgi:hypothetical protein
VAQETTTTTFDDTQFAAWVSSMILDENRPYNVMRPFFRYEGRQHSAAYDFPIQGDPGAATASTEGTTLTNFTGGLLSSKATATAGSNGIMTTVTDELSEISLIDVYAQFGAVLGRSILEKFENDATSLLDEFANTTGTATVPTTLATLIEAVNMLEQRDQMGTAVGVLDPIQTGNVRQDAATSGAAALGSGVANGTLNPTLAGFAFDWAGVNWYQTNAVSATGGAVFLSGVALGLYEIRPLRIENERDASLPGTEVVATSRYGMVEIRDVAGETILI